MLRRFLLTRAVVLLLVLLIPACGGSPTTPGTRGDLPPDQPPPEPKPAGRSG